MHVVDTASSLRQAELDLPQAVTLCGGLVGFDMEWVKTNKVSLVQLAVGDSVWLVRTCCFNFALPSVIRNILTDPSIVKLAIDFGNADSAKCRYSFQLEAQDPVALGILDLSTLALRSGIGSKNLRFGLKKLAARYGYNVEKMKVVSCSNWEAGELTAAQRQYAANDAYFTLLIVQGLLEEVGEQHCAAVPLLSAACRGVAASVGPALNALRLEDCSTKQAAREQLVQDVWLLVSSLVERQGADKVHLRGLLPDLLRRRMRDLGFLSDKDYFKSHKDHFAVVGNELSIRPRSAGERSPHGANGRGQGRPQRGEREGGRQAASLDLPAGPPPAYSMLLGHCQPVGTWAGHQAAAAPMGEMWPPAPTVGTPAGGGGAWRPTVAGLVPGRWPGGGAAAGTGSVGPPSAAEANFEWAMPQGPRMPGPPPAPSRPTAAEVEQRAAVAVAQAKARSAAASRSSAPAGLASGMLVGGYGGRSEDTAGAFAAAPTSWAATSAGSLPGYGGALPDLSSGGGGTGGLDPTLVAAAMGTRPQAEQAMRLLTLQVSSNVGSGASCSNYVTVSWAAR